MGASVHIGNVTEFNDQYRTEAMDPAYWAHRIRGCDEYSSMAPFYAVDPGLVLLPEYDGSPWWDLQADLLSWEHFDPVPVGGSGVGLCDRIVADPVLSAAVRAEVASGSPVVAWGETPGFRRLIAEVAPSQFGALSAPSVHREVESKASSAEIFGKAASALGSDRIALAERIVCTNERELELALAAAGRRGERVVLKSPFGVGGNGTTVLQPRDLAGTRAIRDRLAAIRAADGFHEGFPMVVEQFQWPASSARSHLTGDGTVGSEGVVLEGVYVMLMDGTHYHGAVTDDPDLMDPETRRHVEQYTVAVGEVLAERGYRGWYDVDLIRRADDRLVPLEINARLTGPTIAEIVRRTLLGLGRDQVVLADDDVVLPRRLPSREAFDCFVAAAAAVGADRSAIPTLTAATDAPNPYLGFAVAADRAVEAVELAGRLADAIRVEVTSRA